MSTSAKIESGFLIAGHSRMADFIRAHDWTSTSLGPIEAWSETLLGQVNLVLRSLLPAALILGSERLLLYNDAAISDIGEAHPAALGCSLRQVFHGLWDTLSPVIDRCFLYGETPIQQNLMIPTQRSGVMVDTHWIYSLIPVYDRGEIPGIRCVYQETTELLLAKRERDAFAERLALAQEYGRMVTWEWNVATGEVTWSGDVTSIYGRPAEQMTTVDRLTHVLHEEDREGTLNALNVSLQTGTDYHHEFRCVWPDGLVHWVLACGKPVLSATGPAVRMIGIKRNITDHKRAESDVVAEREDLAELFEEAPAYIAVLSGPDHIFRLANRAHRELIGDRNVLGKPVSEGVPEAKELGKLALLDEVYRTGRRYVAHGDRLLLSRTPGEPPEERFVDHVYQPRRDSEGNVCGIIALGIDVTERRRIEQALIQAEKLAAVGRLASSIAHEINNPLAAVTNYLYLAEASESMEEIRQYLAVIEREVWRVSAISNQTLLSQKQSTSTSSIPLERLVDSVLSLYLARLEEEKIALEIRHRALHPLVCFEGDIRQVLGNLIVNAIDAMQHGGGRLLLRGRESVDWSNGQPVHRLTIADTGSGIPAEILRKIFNPFFTTKGFAGNGLGLWISHEIVTRQRGTLRVRSSTRQERHGTVFVLSLPIPYRCP